MLSAISFLAKKIFCSKVKLYLSVMIITRFPNTRQICTILKNLVFSLCRLNKAVASQDSATKVNTFILNVHLGLGEFLRPSTTGVWLLATPKGTSTDLSTKCLCVVG